MNRPSSCPRHQSGGFTLIELMVVIVLLGILSAMILPEMRGTLSDAVLRSGSRDLINVCALASSRSVSFNCQHRVRIDPATGRFQVEKKGPSVGGQPAFLPVRDVPGCSGELDDRIEARIRRSAQPEDSAGKIGGEETEVAGRAAEPSPEAGAGATQALGFYPDGTADGVEILLRHRDGHGLRLRINPVTARVRVMEWKPR